MREALGRLLSAHSQHPLTKDGSIDQGILPENATQARRPFDQPPDAVMRDKADFHRRRCAEAMIHSPEVKALKIRNVPGDMKGKNLTRAVSGYFVAMKPPCRSRQHCEGVSLS